MSSSFLVRVNGTRQLWEILRVFRLKGFLGVNENLSPFRFYTPRVKISE